MIRKLQIPLLLGLILLLLMFTAVGCSAPAKDSSSPETSNSSPDTQEDAPSEPPAEDESGFKLTFPTPDHQSVKPSICVFKWEKVPDAKEYHLLIAEDENFENIAQEATLESSFSTVKKLTPETTYYWKVIALTDTNTEIVNKGGVQMFHTGPDDTPIVENEEVPPPQSTEIPERPNQEEHINQIKQEWNLTFNDDFEGSDIDWTKWSHAPEWPRVGGACYWSNEESFVDGEGHLIIQVSERDGKYYSGAVRTLGKFEQKQGYFEIRCQLQKEEGFWAAFWLMSPTVGNVGDDGRDGTEIDIMESAYLRSSKINHALHWDGYGDFHQSEGVSVPVPNIYEGFHTFALEWTEDEYIFYIDNFETWRSKAGGVSQVPAYMKITAEVGSWAGNIKSAKLPDAMIVDYVKVYQSPDAAK